MADFNGYVVTRLVGQVNRRNPLALNFVPTLAALFPTPPNRLAAVIKSGTDVISLIVSGMTRIMFAAISLYSPLSITGDGKLQRAAVGQAYDSGAIATAGGQGTYFWSALDALPEGMELVSRRSWSRFRDCRCDRLNQRSGGGGGGQPPRRVRTRSAPSAITSVGRRGPRSASTSSR